MPRATDSDLNKFEDRNIIFTQNVDCPECGTTFDQEFDTGAKDEDGLTQLSQEDITADSVCPSCGHEWEEEFSGWMSYGEAG